MAITIIQNCWSFDFYRCVLFFRQALTLPFHENIRSRSPPLGLIWVSRSGLMTKYPAMFISYVKTATTKLNVFEFLLKLLANRFLHFFLIFVDMREMLFRDSDSLFCCFASKCLKLFWTLEFIFCFSDIFCKKLSSQQTWICWKVDSWQKNAIVLQIVLRRELSTTSCCRFLRW